MGVIQLSGAEIFPDGENERSFWVIAITPKRKAFFLTDISLVRQENEMKLISKENKHKWLKFLNSVEGVVSSSSSSRENTSDGSPSNPRRSEPMKVKSESLKLSGEGVGPTVTEGVHFLMAEGLSPSEATKLSVTLWRLDNEDTPGNENEEGAGEGANGLLWDEANVTIERSQEVRVEYHVSEPGQFELRFERQNVILKSLPLRVLPALESAGDITFRMFYNQKRHEMSQKKMK